MITITHLFKCSFCKETKEHNYPYLIGSTPAKPQLPANWYNVPFRSAIICPNHEVKTFVDGKEISL